MGSREGKAVTTLLCDPKELTDPLWASVGLQKMSNDSCPAFFPGLCEGQMGESLRLQKQKGATAP